MFSVHGNWGSWFVCPEKDSNFIAISLVKWWKWGENGQNCFTYIFGSTPAIISVFRTGENLTDKLELVQYALMDFFQSVKLVYFFIPCRMSGYVKKPTRFSQSKLLSQANSRHSCYLNEMFNIDGRWLFVLAQCP